MPTSNASLKELVERTLRAWDEEDMELFDEVYARDVAIHGAPIDGREELKDLHDVWYDAFPDLTHIVEDLVAEEDRVALRFSLEGTHEGTFQGVNPTGAEIDVPGMAIFRIDDGQITEQWFVEDDLRLFDQLGAVEPPA